MKWILTVSILITGLISGFFLFYSSPSVDNFQETIAHYPIDENKKFTKTSTTIDLIDEMDEDEYTLLWKTDSEFDEKSYLSHDISLLFEDGRLKETMSLAVDNDNKLSQKMKLNGEDSGHFEAITFHYRQINYDNEVTKSVQTMSYDQLYILDSPLSSIEIFKEPNSEAQKEGKRILDTIIHQNLEYTWEELINYFHIQAENYHHVPLTHLAKHNQQALPNLSIDETKELLATTWRGLYKYYFLGVEKHDGTVKSPIGSSVPLVLFHKSYSHIIIIFTNEDGAKYNIVKNTGRF